MVTTPVDTVDYMKLASESTVRYQRRAAQIARNVKLSHLCYSKWLAQETRRILEDDVPWRSVKH